MVDSVTECNLKGEMSPQIKTKKNPIINQNVTAVVVSYENSQNQIKMLSETRGNLKVAMLKQAKNFKQKFKTVPSNKVTSKKQASVKRLMPQIRQSFSRQSNLIKTVKSKNSLKSNNISISKEIITVEEPLEASTSNNIDKKSLLSKQISLSLLKENNNEMDDLKDLKKQNSDILSTKKSAKTKNDTMNTDESTTFDPTKVRSPEKEQVLPTIRNNEDVYFISEMTVKKNVKVDDNKIQSPTPGSSLIKKETLIVRKPLKPTKIINGLEHDIKKLPKLVTVRSSERSPSNVFPFSIPKQKTCTEEDANRKQADKVILNFLEKTADHKFPKSITVKTIPLSTSDRDKIEYKPFRAFIGGRFVTLRRTKTDDSGACGPPCSKKQPTTKMCVRKAPDGTYRVSSNSNINTNGLTIKKFKSNVHNSELKKVEPPVLMSLNIPESIVHPSDKDNQPSTSNAAYKRKSATFTHSSTVPPKEFSDEEQFVVSSVKMPIKYSNQNKSDSEEITRDNDKHRKNLTLTVKQRNGIIVRRNTCFVIKDQDPTKQLNGSLKAMKRNASLMSDHVNYTIPQSLLTSSTEHALRKMAASSSESFSNQSVPSTISPPNEEDLFLIEEDSNQKPKSVPMNNSGGRRRKTILEPMKTFSGDTKFVTIEEPFIIPARPRQNIQLIESLARYRTIVRFILNHLEIHQIDFNNDDYINLYKFYRG